MQTAKLFRSGRSQVVRLPKEFRFKGDRVFIKKVGSSVVLIPYQEPWQTLFESLDQFSDDFMEDREQPMQQEFSLGEWGQQWVGPAAQAVRDPWSCWRLPPRDQ